MPKPNREHIISEMLVLLAGHISFGECLELNGTKWNLKRSTFIRYWNEAGIRHKETEEAAQKAISDTTINKTIEAAKKGLKSRLEYCMEIQKQLDDDIYEESVLDLKTGKVTRYHRKLTPLERKALYERISKFEGLDEPAKTDITTGGDKINSVNDNQFETLLNAVTSGKAK